jgi:GAF domain-containing protein
VVDFENICKEVLVAAVRNHKRYVNTDKATPDNQHKFLTQIAIMRQLWNQVEGQKGYRSKQLLATAFHELDKRKWLKVQKGKQNALHYFPTDLGMKVFSEYLAHERSIVDDFNGKQIHLINSKQKRQLALNISEVLQALQYHFEQQLKEEQVLSAISGRFVSFPSFSGAISASLLDIGKLLGADRVFLKLFHEQRTWLPNEFEWCAPGVHSAIGALDNYHPDRFPWSMRKMQSIPNIWIQDENSSLEEGTDEGELLWNQSARSLLILPVFGAEEFRGVFGIVDLQGTQGVMDEDVRLLRVCCEIFGAALVRLETNYALNGRVKELECLYKIAEIVQQPELGLKQIFKKVVKLLPLSWQYPEITGACIVFKDEQFSTPQFSKDKWALSSEITSGGNRVGLVTVSYSEKRPDVRLGEGPFQKEEKLLLEAITEYLGRIVEHKEAEEALQRIEWLLKPKPSGEKYSEPSYGSLVELNTSHVLLDLVGEDILAATMNDYLNLIETSAAIYEKNGDYALGILSSSWCRFCDQASRNLCGTNDNREALASGKWLCHESCWTDASKVSIETGQPVDIECHGGIHIYAVPIWAGEEIIGAINFGYGDPPRNLQKLQEIAEKFGVNKDDLFKQATLYESRPHFIIEMAKKQLKSSANLIGALAESKRADETLQVTYRLLEIANRHSDMDSLLNAFITEIQSFTGCTAVGIRFLDENGNIPYESYNGFNRDFYEMENPLSIISDHCMCSTVIKGETDPNLLFFTNYGSFYTNETTRFLATASEEVKSQTRNICNLVGFESVALVPIRLGGRIHGLIHLADYQENKIPLKAIMTLENAALQLGIAIQRVWTEESRKNAELQAQQQQILLNNTIEILSQPFYVINANNYQITLANSAGGLGPLSEDSACFSITHNQNKPCTGKDHPCPLEEVKRTKKPAIVQHVHYDNNGNARTYEIHGYPVLDREGNVQQMIEFNIEITDQAKE